MSHNINCYRFFETSYRIDWTTIGSRESKTTSVVTASGVNWTNAGPSITVSNAGTYLFITNVSLVSVDNQTDYKHGIIRIQNTSNNTTIGPISDAWGFQAGGLNGLQTLTTCGIATVSANHVIKPQFKTSINNAIRTANENGSGSNLVCIRIGSANA